MLSTLLSIEHALSLTIVLRNADTNKHPYSIEEETKIVMTRKNKNYQSKAIFLVLCYFSIKLFHVISSIKQA